MTKLLKPKGTFYLSVPLGAPRVEFNAHRISDPAAILQLANQNRLDLVSFVSVMQDGTVQALDVNGRQFKQLSDIPYSLGIFVFIKRSEK